jgi:glucokinase
MLLAGDIGGTKTDLAVYALDGDAHHPIAQAAFPSADFGNLESLAHTFLRQSNLSVDRAVFGVAGPVVAGRVEGTNLPWVIDERTLARELDLKAVRLLNDLQSIAYAVTILGSGDLATLSAGKPMVGGALAVVAPGTGLGEAYLTWDGARYEPHASEGGHGDFGPNSGLEIDLLRYLHKRFGHVSVERVCSGVGIPNIYDFMRDSGYAEEPEWLREQLDAATDPTPVIVSAALDSSRPCELCTAVLDTFVSILGAEAGNMALKVLSSGGVYIAGGIPPRILPALRQRRFLAAFRSKGRLSYLLEEMPVHVVLNAKAGLLGAAHYGLTRF